MGGYFEPRQDELLYEWLHDGNEFPATMIWNNDINKTAQTDKFRKAIDKKSKHGFQRHYFSLSDDSKHCDLNRQVLIISSFDNDDEQWR